MRNLEYLTEGDLPYFRKLAERGEAVIIELDPAVLLDMDILQLFEETEANKPLSEEMLRAWIQSHPGLLKKQQKDLRIEEDETVEMQQEPERNRTAEPQQIGRINVEQLLMTKQLGDMQTEIFLAALEEDFTDEELTELIDVADSTKVMQEVFTRILADRAQKEGVR